MATCIKVNFLKSWFGTQMANLGPLEWQMTNMAIRMDVLFSQVMPSILPSSGSQGFCPQGSLGTEDLHLA